MLGFWVNLRKVGLGPKGHGELPRGFEQESDISRYFTGWFGRPPEKWEVLYIHWEEKRALVQDKVTRILALMRWFLFWPGLGTLKLFGALKFHLELLISLLSPDLPRETLAEWLYHPEVRKWGPGWILNSTILRAILWGRCCYQLHFTDEKTEAWRGSTTYPKSWSQEMAESKFNLLHYTAFYESTCFPRN